MSYNNLLDMRRLERERQEKENELALDILLEYQQICEAYEIPFYNKYETDFTKNLLYNYFWIKKQGHEELLDMLLQEHRFNYSRSIHNAIYNLLDKDFRCSKNGISTPSNWPGIIDINNNGNKITLETNAGQIEVYNACEYYKNTNSSYIFERELSQKCFFRSFDFVKENKKDYKVVLSYIYSFIYGGFYHAYVKGNGEVLDISANSVYLSEEDANKTLKGEILTELSYDEIMDEYEKIEKDMPQLKDERFDKLYVLSLYNHSKKLHNKNHS